MLRELRRTLVLMPVDGGGLWAAELGGVRWVCGFTDEAALARFARARGALHDPGAGGGVWKFAALRGARLLDKFIPAMGAPAGLAVNIADPDGSMYFPPVTGIVPDAVAVDREPAAVGESAADAPGRGGGRGR